MTAAHISKGWQVGGRPLKTFDPRRPEIQIFGPKYTFATSERPPKTPREGPAKGQKELGLLIIAKVERGVVDFPKGGHLGAQKRQNPEILASKWLENY